MIALLLALALDWVVVLPATADKVPRLELQHGEQRGTCSGAVVRVDDGWAYVLTAAHCVTRGPGEITINDRPAIVLEQNAPLDVAVLKVRAKHEQPLALATAAPRAGADVAVIGYAFGVSEPVAQFGHVAQSYNAETKSLWLDVVTIGGDSGGAVVNGAGELVGLVSRSYSSSAGGSLSGAVPLEALRDVLAHVLERERPRK